MLGRNNRDDTDIPYPVGSQDQARTKISRSHGTDLRAAVHRHGEKRR